MLWCNRRSKSGVFIWRQFLKMTPNFGGYQPNWRHFEIFADGLKNKMFGYFLDTTGLAPHGTDFTPSVFFSYGGEKKYAFRDEKQQKTMFFVIFLIL